MEINDKAIRLRTLRDKRIALNKEVAEMTEQIHELEQAVIDELRSNQMTMARVNGYTISITDAIVPVAEDWDEIYNYLISNAAPYLLERRVSIKPWRELAESGMVVPGTSVLTKTKVNLRKLRN